MRMRGMQADPPPLARAREGAAAEARHLEVVRMELLELADRVIAVLGDRGAAARTDLLHAAGRVAGAIAAVHRGAGR
jgi:hypothetical protein